LEIGQPAMAPMLNEQGGVEALPTLVRTGEEAYLLVADARQTTHLKDWVERNRSVGEASVADVTASLAALAIFGPKMNHLVARNRKDRVVENVAIGYADATIMPFLETGGLYVLIPAEAAKNAFSALLDSDRDLGLVVGGSLAINALLTLSCAPRFGAEVTPFRSAVKLGLDIRLDIDRNQTFIGRSAVMRDREETGKCIRQYVIHMPPTLSFDNLPLLRKGRIVGCVTSGAFIPALGNSIVTGFLDRHDQAERISCSTAPRFLSNHSRRCRTKLPTPLML
jgi:glycine cleavage system aminomethyltransferase T